jgi:outer membrane protein assembly factor BamB
MRFVLASLLLICPLAAQSDGLPWLQWGGPHRNFQTEAKLPDSWPAAGPKILWRRGLGEGYSSILVENGRLYTMYRNISTEYVIAADSNTGQTIWEFSYNAPFHNDAAEEGNGPHATPAIAGDRIFTAGASGKLHCLDKKTGKVLWEHDLWSFRYGGSSLIYGYASSPLVYRDTIILPVGGDGRAMMCFRQSDGATVWKKGDAGNAYSSAVLINVNGLDQAVVMTRFHVVAFNPINGDVQWSHEHNADYGLNIMTPLWGASNILVVSASYNAGTTALQLTRTGNQTNVKELWHSNDFYVKHVNMQRIGDVLYASSGNSGPTPLSAADVKTGKILWRQRGYPEANLIYADGKVIILDQDGNLSLATVSLAGLKVLSTAPSLLKSNAWTPPTLSGTHLYIRDRHEMMALDLGK